MHEFKSSQSVTLKQLGAFHVEVSIRRWPAREKVARCELSAWAHRRGQKRPQQRPALPAQHGAFGPKRNQEPED